MLLLREHHELIDTDSLTPSDLGGFWCAGIAAFNLLFGLAFGRWASLTEARELLRFEASSSPTTTSIGHWPSSHETLAVGGDEVHPHLSFHRWHGWVSQTVLRYPDPFFLVFRKMCARTNWDPICAQMRLRRKG